MYGDGTSSSVVTSLLETDAPPTVMIQKQRGLNVNTERD